MLPAWECNNNMGHESFNYFLPQTNQTSELWEEYGNMELLADGKNADYAFSVLVSSVM